MANSSSKNMLSGTGKLFGPQPNSQFDSIIKHIAQSLPHFAISAIADSIDNENGLNRRLVRFICSVFNKANLPFIALSESMEDETRGNSPAVDIGIHLYQDDIATDLPKVTVFEGKRLTERIDPKRHREYVIGHKDGGKHICCGGIERFKLLRHGGKFNHVGMIGYIQDGAPDDWREKINSWITELSHQDHDPAWLAREHLTVPQTDGPVTVCSSIVYRPDSDLYMEHLWVQLFKSQ